MLKQVKDSKLKGAALNTGVRQMIKRSTVSVEGPSLVSAGWPEGPDYPLQRCPGKDTRQRWSKAHRNILTSEGLSQQLLPLPQRGCAPLHANGWRPDLSWKPEKYLLTWPPTFQAPARGPSWPSLAGSWCQGSRDPPLPDPHSAELLLPDSTWDSLIKLVKAICEWKLERLSYETNTCTLDLGDGDTLNTST